MDNTKVKDLEVNQDLIGYYLVKDILLKEGANGCYLDMIFADQTGVVNAKLWQCDPKDGDRFVRGSLVKIMGRVAEYRGKLQLNVAKIRLTTKEDGVNIEDYVSSAPLNAEDMLTVVREYAQSIEDADIKKVVLHFLQKNQKKLLYYPAAKSMHHAIRGGLLYHLLRMLQLAEAVAEVYPLLKRDLLYAGVILHDMEKTSELESDELGLAEYTLEGELLGHLVMGVRNISDACKTLTVPESKSLILQHLVLSHHQKLEFGSPKPPMIPEAEMLHFIDMMDARQYSFEEALNNIEPGEMSERIFALDNRRVYHYEG